MSQPPAGKRALACCPDPSFTMKLAHPALRALPAAPRFARVPTVLCLALLAAYAAPTFAQTTLSPVVVSGSREPLPLDRVTADVVVIDAQRIRESTADSIEDLLRREAGVQVSRNGGPGQSAGVFIRGAGSGNTVVLIDGVRVGSATLGQVEFEAISLSQIERIEVLRGPGSSLYGADAVGGVVQIFTRRGEGDLRVAGNLALGGHRSRDGSVGVSGAQGGFDYAASLSRQSSQGVSALKAGDRFGNYNPDDDGYTRDTAQLKLGFTPAAGQRVGVNLIESRHNSQYDASEYIAPNFIQDATPDFRSKLKTSIASLDYRGEFGPGMALTAQAAHSDDDLKSGGTEINRFRTQRDQFTLQGAWAPLAGQQFVAAFEHLTERAHSDLFAADESRRNDALVLGYTGQLGVHTLQADVRQDRNSVYGSHPTGRLGWSMEVAKGLRVRVLGGSTFRAPSFNELFYPGYGVPTVTPEKGRSVELGLTWRSGATEVSATAYENRVRDMIGFETNSALCPADPTYQYGCARNIGEARLRGGTLSATHRWGSLRVAATLDVLDAQDLIQNKRLARRAAHQESLSADYDMGAWSVGAAVLAVGRRPDDGADLGAYETLDLRARWRFTPQWQLEAKLLNATNRNIEPVRDYQQIGRQAWLGVRFDGRGL